jgi:glycosyltransferase involved in cell wall biosynthesis
MQKKIKVLVVDGIYPPAYTGSGLRAHRTYKRLSSNYPIEFAVLTTTKGGLKPGPDEYDGVKIYRTKANKSFVSQIIQVYWLFKTHKLYDYDIVHGFGDSLVVLAAGLVGKYYSLKLIYEITVFSEQSKTLLIHKLKNILNSMRFGFSRIYIYKYGDLFIAINETIFKHYIKRGISQDKIWKRPNPVDNTRFYFPDLKEKLIIRKSLQIPEDAFVILIVGRLETRKNQMFAIRVIKKLPENYFLMMVGPKDNDESLYGDNIKREIKENGVLERVKLLPEFRNDIEIFYKASDTLWIPSISEGTPNVMLEALCCGVPVVANESLGLEEFIIEGENGYRVKLLREDFESASIKLGSIIRNNKARENIALVANSVLDNKLIDYDFSNIIQKISNNKYINNELID